MNPLLYEEIVRRELLDDMGRAGDITTDSIVPAEIPAVGKIWNRRPGCIAGIEIATSAFRLLEEGVEIELLKDDGARVGENEVLAVLKGSARTLLQGERTALNLLGHLSGIATATCEMVQQVKEFGTRIVCTRKTTPGLRSLEKYAVRVGGGFNHRFGLDDAVLIKENHIAFAGSVSEAVRRARRSIGHLVKVEVEVETVAQLREALELEIDAVLLDNMSVETVRRAVELSRGRVLTEVSGGITPDNVVPLAAAGVDLLSVGYLTHSSPALDVTFEILPS
jgi:nicotinate-nucleotide pyrophosphorylase (carboxylating)